MQRWKWAASALIMLWLASAPALASTAPRGGPQGQAKAAKAAKGPGKKGLARGVRGPVKKAKAQGLTRRPARRGRIVQERAVPTYTRSGLPNIQAQAAVVVDMKEGTSLFQKNPDAVRPIASISKLMAMMVVLDRKLDLDGKTAITEEDRRVARGGARSRLPVGMTFTNRDLLHAALMASDNRAVPALGRAVGLSPEQLTAAMNAKAREMGLKVTRFGDPTGLDHRNVSTPTEVAEMLKAALRNPLIAEICQTARYVAHPVGSPRQSIEYANTDVLVRGSRHKVLGGKTGYNDEAGYCLAVAARLQDAAGKPRDVAMVFLGASGKLTRFADFSRAAQWISERGAPGLTGQTGSLAQPVPTKTL
jgi:D-alanyl-D-alanine endopeptidase (penicillin-binding protein 7)